MSNRKPGKPGSKKDILDETEFINAIKFLRQWIAFIKRFIRSGSRN